MIDGIDAAVPGFRASLSCVFTGEHALFTFDDGRMLSGKDLDWSKPMKGRVRVTKDLLSLARHCGRPIGRCLIVDDTPETYKLNPSNALPVPMYDAMHHTVQALPLYSALRTLHSALCTHRQPRAVRCCRYEGSTDDHALDFLRDFLLKMPTQGECPQGLPYFLLLKSYILPVLASCCVPL